MSRRDSGRGELVVPTLISKVIRYFGAGYRVYFGREGDALVLLLAGGSKGSQARDIRMAQAFWREYLGGP
jgi:putative addiction module killer protein